MRDYHYAYEKYIVSSRKKTETSIEYLYGMTVRDILSFFSFLFSISFLENDIP